MCIPQLYQPASEYRGAHIYEQIIPRNIPGRVCLKAAVLLRALAVLLNYERVVAKPIGQPAAQTIRMTVRLVW